MIFVDADACPVKGAGQVAIRQRENGFRHKFERYNYIAKDRDNPDLRRKALTAITATIPRSRGSE